MSDVTITVEDDRESQLTFFRFEDDASVYEFCLDDAKAAALREHFKAEHDADLVARYEVMLRDSIRSVGELLAERDAAREQVSNLEHAYKIQSEQYDELREQLAQAEAVIKQALDALPENRPDGEVGVAVHKAVRILSGYPVSSALTERDAAVWDEGWDAHRRYGYRDVYPNAPIVNPYRVTPTKESDR